MGLRKIPLRNGQCYHIFTRSISKYVIFNNAREYDRIIQLINIQRFIDFDLPYSKFDRMKDESKFALAESLKLTSKTYVDIITYCLMPTHIHLLLKQNINNGITKYMAKVLNSYSKYFNTKHKRKGPLFSDRFKNVLVDEDEQLLHLTRYIHLNPISAGIIKNPDEWNYSSYDEYINSKENICKYKNILDIEPEEYKKFVLDHKNYQKNLSLIKNILIDNYSG